MSASLKLGGTSGPCGIVCLSHLGAGVKEGTSLSASYGTQEPCQAKWKLF